ncbi:hypothetical protein MLD38_020116 [Melastoma candidum]|uniref:Uncharacterized protein n=1 Tax=Melastoma candidum TaxID=119954 RepID=A0ACB9QEW9_9MYRT|nr:hypothetical protein MLD38_020116 [Melastoma candidum]
MTKVSPEIGENVLAQPFLSVSADVSFASDSFPKYKLGPDNRILEEPKDEDTGPSLKEVVERENAQLSEQHKRLSVRDLASKFDKNLAAAAKLSDEAKLREVSSLEGHVLLKKLRDALESLRSRLTGKNKEDVEKAISMVEVLAVKLTQKEGELIQEKFEVQKLVNFLKQASEDAKKLVGQEKSFACAEIESARAVVQRFGEALEEEERSSKSSKNQDVARLLEEVQQARRIKLLHQPSKVMDMELELQALRIQIREKSIFSFKLQNELTLSKRAEESRSRLYVLDGSEMLGSYLQIRPTSPNAPSLSRCTIQWFRLSSDGTQQDVISGATTPSYAPEPLDVGRVLLAEISINGQKDSLITVGSILHAAGQDGYVETLMRKSHAEFSVIVSQMNGHDHPSHSSHILNVGKTRMKLCRGWISKAREIYSTSMQLCGVRSDGSNAAREVFWQARKGLSFVLTFVSERERNAALILARKYALDSNVELAGPDDHH